MALLFRAVGSLFAIALALIIIGVGGASIVSFFVLIYVLWVLVGASNTVDPAAITSFKPANSSDAQSLYRRIQIGATLDQVTEMAGTVGDIVAAKRVDADELHARRWNDNLG